MKNIISSIGIVILAIIIPFLPWSFITLIACMIEPASFWVIVGIYVLGMIASVIFSIRYKRHQQAEGSTSYGFILIVYFMLWSWFDFIAKRSIPAVL